MLYSFIASKFHIVLAHVLLYWILLTEKQIYGILNISLYCITNFSSSAMFFHFCVFIYKESHLYVLKINIIQSMFRVSFLKLNIQNFSNILQFIYPIIITQILNITHFMKHCNFSIFNKYTQYTSSHVVKSVIDWIVFNGNNV